MWGADIHLGRPLPILMLAKTSASPTTFAGATITSSYSYANGGAASATNVLWSDVLPPNVSYVPNSATGNGNYSPATHTLSWSQSCLPPAQSGQVTFQVTVNANVAAGTEITNTASIGAAEVTTPVFSNIAVTLVLSATQGDWWMFHHDMQHTGRSPYLGAASPGQRWASASGNTDRVLRGARGGWHPLHRLE